MLGTCLGRDGHSWLSPKAKVVEDLGTCLPLRFYGDGAEFTSDLDGITVLYTTAKMI